MKIKAKDSCLLLYVFLSGIFLLSPTEVNALPSQGYWIPRTQTLTYSEIRYDLQLQQNLEKGKPNQMASAMGLTGGLVEWNKLYVESGLDWLEPTTADWFQGVVAHVKTSYRDWDLDGWSLSLGVKGFAIQPGQHDENMFYSLMETKIGEKWVVAMGGFTANETRVKTATGAFVGVWHRIQSGAGDVGIEWLSGQSKLGAVVPGIRLKIRDGFDGIISYVFSADPKTYRNLFLTRLMVYF